MEDEKVGAADVGEVSPSPWVVGERFPTDGWWRVESPPRYPGGDVVADHVANVFGEADARLIAAAPDLLAACEAMEEWDRLENTAPPYDSDNGAHFRMRTQACERSFDLARAAIRRARGQTNDEPTPEQPKSKSRARTP